MNLLNHSMSVKEAIEIRRSIRRYKPDPIPDTVMHELIEAARLAPSGSNAQPWRFMIISDSQQRADIARLGGNQRQLVEAPVIMVCCGDLTRMTDEQRNKRRSELRDAGVYDDIGIQATGWLQSRYTQAQSTEDLKRFIPNVQANVFIAIEHIVLRASSLGLGTCWVGAFDHEKVHTYLQLPDHLFIVMLLPVGYPAQNPKPRARLSIEEILLSPPGK